MIALGDEAAEPEKFGAVADQLLLTGCRAVACDEGSTWHSGGVALVRGPGGGDSSTACRLRQTLVNVCESISGLLGQGSLILVNFSVLPDSVKEYLPGLWHPLFAAGFLNVIVEPAIL